MNTNAPRHEQDEPVKPEDQQPTAFKNMDTGAIVPHGDSMHDEGKTTSNVNHAAEDHVTSDKDTLRNASR